MPTEDLQRVLPHLLGAPLPDVVDSACLAGLLDLHRTRGLWRASLRYGYVFGGLRDARCAISLSPDTTGYMFVNEGLFLNQTENAPPPPTCLSLH